MAKNSKVSMGGRTEAKRRQAAKREERFKQRRENGLCYVYTPNPFPEGSKQWRKEKKRRATKVTTSKKLPYAQNVSLFAKLRNELEKKRNAEKLA